MLLLNEYKTDSCCFVDLAREKGVEQGLRWLERVVSQRTAGLNLSINP